MQVSGDARRRAAAAVLVAAGVGLGAWAVAADSGSDPLDPSPESASVHDVLDAEPVTTIRSRPPRRHPAAGVPARVRVPSMGIDAPIIGIDVVDGVLTPPADAQTLGWWRDGARPGALQGRALVTGHTVSVGGGALDDLEEVRVGAPVTVTTDNGTIRYRVSKVAVYRKARLARDAQRVFDQEGPGGLLLITCEDWDGEKYLSNVVVYADPVARA